MAGNVTVYNVGSFDFVPLYAFLQEALKNTTGDPLSSPYFQQGSNYISITNDVCLNITGSERGTWAVYDNQGIWNRIVTWKLPLVTLLFQFARPPFPFRLLTNTNVFILMRLIGNPIGTIASLLFTVQSCQTKYNEIRNHLINIQNELSTNADNELSRQLARKQSSLCKIFTLICISYDEWMSKRGGSMPFLKASLIQILSHPTSSQSQAALRHFENAAFVLAADRSTYILPIFIAQIAFVFSLGAAFWRILGVPPHPGSWTNVEAYSIAMSAPFLAILPAVLLSAVLGVSQTESSVPRILNELRGNLLREDWSPPPLAGRGRGGEMMIERIPLGQVSIGKELLLRGIVEDEEENGEEMVTFPERVANGGMYAWQPEMFSLRGVTKRLPLIIVASVFVVFSVLVAGWISFRVPPDGFDCRNTAQAALLGVWMVVAFGLDFLFTALMERHEHHRKFKGWCWYEIVFIKDVIMAMAALTLIMVVQFGIFNRCDCYTLWGRAPLALPQIEAVTADLMDRIALEWPLVTFSWILAEVGMCLAIWGWYYREAFRVYTQKDDGTSNLDWVPAWVMSAWRRVSREEKEDVGIVIRGVDPEAPLLDGARVSGDTTNSATPGLTRMEPAGRSSARKGDAFGEIGPTPEEWASSATTELMNLRRRAT